MNLGDPASLLDFFVRKWGGVVGGQRLEIRNVEYYGGSGSVSRMQGFGFRDFGFKMEGSGLSVQGLGFSSSGSRSIL